MENDRRGYQELCSDCEAYGLKAGIPPGKSDASGGIGPRHIVTSTSGFPARCGPMRPIFPVEFQLKKRGLTRNVLTSLRSWLN